MAENFSRLQPEAMPQLHTVDLYQDFWKLAGEAQRTTKFADDEKNIARRLLEQTKHEQNPIRRQYLALALIPLGELQTAQKLFDQNFWSPQLKADFATFEKWQNIAYNPITPQTRAKIARNEQILAFLQKKYSALIQKYSQAVIDEKNCPRVQPKDYQIYFCWLQGKENLPPIIRCCYNSLKRNAGSYKIVFIDEKNFSNYVDIAPHIMDKFRAGKITRTHFSDILRVNLLERHGGLWLDSTILVTEPLEKHKDFWQMNYFTQKKCHDKNPIYGTWISYTRWAGFIQGTPIRHNPFFTFEAEIFNEYWKDFDQPIVYDFMDFFTEIAYDNIPAVREEIDAVPINNTEVWTLLKHLNDSYADYPFDKILANNFLNKLSWKVTLDMTRPDTVFREIQRRYAPETI